MLIVVLNKIFAPRSLAHIGAALFLTLTLSVHHTARAHGDHGGLDLEERVELYKSFLIAQQDATREVEHVLHELELKYHNGPRVHSDDEAKIVFMNEHIDVYSSAFTRFFDHSIGILRERLKSDCPHGCEAEIRLLASRGLMSRVAASVKQYLVHYLLMLGKSAKSPYDMAKWALTGQKPEWTRPLAVWSAGIAAEAVKMTIVHGVSYLLWTGVTEAIEFSVMGPYHWACPFFQMMYLPVALVGVQVWRPMINSGWGARMSTRLKVSMRALYAMARYRIEMRRLYVEATVGRPLFTMRHSDYRDLVAGTHDHLEKELNDKHFWDTVYRNFHAPDTRPYPLSLKDMNLQNDLDKIFAAGPTVYSERERFYVAIKLGDGLNYFYKTIEKISAEQAEAAQLSLGSYFLLSRPMGSAGLLIKELSLLLKMGALASRKNPELQAHQAALARRGLEGFMRFFTNFESIASPAEMSTPEWRARMRVLKSELHQDRLALQRGLRTKARFDQNKLDQNKPNCRELVGQVAD